MFKAKGGGEGGVSDFVKLPKRGWGLENLKF